MASFDYYQPLEPECIYHIFNHAIGEENLFRQDKNYLYFLKKYSLFINPIADTYSYCLLPNHFHLALKFKSKEDVLNFYTSLIKEESTTHQKFNTFEEFLSKQFAKLFSSYTQSFNKVYGRSGGLFIPQFKRVKIDNNNQFKNLIHYIHYNPVKHGFVEKVGDWKYSSYYAYVSEKITKLSREEGIKLFDSMEGFHKLHKMKPDYKMFLNMDF